MFVEIAAWRHLEWCGIVCMVVGVGGLCGVCSMLLCVSVCGILCLGWYGVVWVVYCVWDGMGWKRK